MTIFRRLTILAALVAAPLLLPGRSIAQPTNSLDFMKSSHEMALLEIGADCVQHEKKTVTQYGKSLAALLEALKKKGDLEGYLVVETEMKRFSSEGTVPEAGGPVPVLAAAVQAYHKTVADADSDRDRATVALLKDYVASLDGLIKQLVQAGKMEDAKTVKEERDRAAGELADLQAKKPQGVRQLPVAETNPTKKVITKEAKVFKGHRYLLIHDKLTWHQAKKACAKMGGHLVTITSKEENDCLATLTSDLAASGEGFFWMGCTDEAKEGDWRWVDGGKVTYSAWYPGEPNNGRDSGGVEHYGGSRFLQGASDWNDVPADSAGTGGYVCEWDDAGASSEDEMKQVTGSESEPMKKAFTPMRLRRGR